MLDCTISSLVANGFFRLGDNEVLEREYDLLCSCTRELGCDYSITYDVGCGDDEVSDVTFSCSVPDEGSVTKLLYDYCSRLRFGVCSLSVVAGSGAGVSTCYSFDEGYERLMACIGVLGGYGIDRLAIRPSGFDDGAFPGLALVSCDDDTGFWSLDLVRFVPGSRYVGDDYDSKLRELSLA